jgi:hypothetical protein
VFRVATKTNTQNRTDAGAQKRTDTGDQTADRIRELNERIIEAAREAGSNYLDAYERALGAIVGYQEELAKATPVEWIQRAIEGQATFTREVGDLYTSTAREMLKK